MNRYHFVLRPLVVALLTLTLVGCGKSESQKPKTPTAEKTAPQAEKKPAEPTQSAGGHDEGAAVKLTPAEIVDAGIRTATVAEEPVRAGIDVSATIQPNRDRYARVSPRVGGRILEAPAKAGDSVRAGQVLARLDSVEVGEAMSSYRQNVSQFNVAKADFDRAETLFKEQVIPQKDYLRAKAEFEKSRAALAAAGEKLHMMGFTGEQKLKPSTAVLSVTAPFAGTVIEKTAVIGELAQPDKALFTVADLSTVWIEANLSERDIARVKSGTEATVSVAAYPDQRFKGRLAYVSAVVDRESRTVKGRIEVPNADGRLKPEMFASARILTEEASRAIAVPVEAIVLLDNKPNVFVKDGDGFEPRPVELGDVISDRQVVKSGLRAGDQAVIAGAYALKSRILKSKLGEGHGH